MSDHSLGAFSFLPACFILMAKDAIGAEIMSGYPGVPFLHFVLKLSAADGPEERLRTYQKLLSEVRHVQARFGGGPDYNVIMTREWMCLIPRRHGGKDGIGTSALGMLGVVWVADKRERDAWTVLGLEKHLEYMGYPREQK